jgi:hypothetical protein
MISPMEDKHRIEENFLNSISEEILLEKKESKNDPIKEFVTSFLNEHIEATKHRRKSLITAFEMFLVFIYHGKRFADFVSLLRVKANEFVEKEITSFSSMIWFLALSTDEKRNLKKRFKNQMYKFLFEIVSGVYGIFKDVRLLKIGELLHKYPFLSTRNEKLKRELLNLSSVVSAEDVFLVGLSRVAYSSGTIYNPEQLISAINNSGVINLFQINDETSAFKSIETLLPSIQGKFTLSKAVQNQIKWIIGEYLDPRNPYTKESTFLATSDEVSLPQLLTIAPKPRDKMDSMDDLPLQQISSHIPESTPCLSAALQLFFKQGRTVQEIKAAIQAKAVNTKVFDFNEEDDHLMSSSEFRLFKCTDCIQTPLAGALSLLLHAIRLLYLQETLDGLSVFHFTSQLLLNKLCSEDLKLVDAARNLNLNESEYSLIIRQFLLGNKSKQFTELGTVQFQSIPSDVIFSNSIKELLRKLERKDANVFFVNISLPSERNNGLPRVLKYSFNAKTKNFEDDSSSLSNDTNDLQLVLFGSVYYSNLNRNYKFQFVSFSKKLYSGKHCIVTFSDGNSQNIAPLEQHTRLPFSIDGSYNLVGLVLLRNGQIGLYPPNETIWRISTDSKFINNGLPLQITTICLCELESNGRGGWLSSLTINAFLALLSNSLGGGQSKSKNILVDASFYQSFHMTRDDGIDMVSEGEQTVYMKYGLKLLKGISSDSLIHFPLNTDKSHWRYACADIKARIVYVMNSYGSNAKEVCDRLIGFFKGAYSGVWKCISLQCPYQDDGYNCGIFTIMNIAYVVLRIEQTQTTDVLTNAKLNKVWGKKIVPCKQIREALAAKLIHKVSNIDDILEIVKA